MSRIDAFNPTASSLDMGARQNLAQEGRQAGVGQFGGQLVQVDTTDSILTDAAEEISLHHSEKAEKKHASERKKEAARPHDMLSPEAITAYMDAAQAHEDAEELVNLAKGILARMSASAAGSGSAARGARDGGAPQTGRRTRGRQDDELQEIRKTWGNPAHRILALQYIIQMGEREGHPEENLQDLRDELEDLELEHGDALRADLNTIGTASENARSKEDVEAFQRTYRDVVLGENTLAQTLDLALERFGDSDFAGGLKRLVQALGQDLAAARPSGDPTRLQSLVQDLYHLSVASTVLDGCRELCQRIDQQRGAPIEGSPVTLMQQMVRLSAEKWVAGSRFTSLSSEFGADLVPTRIQFLTGVKALLRDMPPKVFVDTDQRLTVFQAVQDALDVAIDDEDA